jgi:type II secretory pathway predicted ATPase ExeA
MIAKPGMGKTTLLFHALDELRDKETPFFNFRPCVRRMSSWGVILVDLGVQQTEGTLFELQVKLNDFLVEQARSGKQVNLVIDEGQNLDDSVLEVGSHAPARAAPAGRETCNAAACSITAESLDRCSLEVFL